MTITIDAAAFAAVLEALPARLRKRLDASVERAAQWPHEESADSAGGVLIRVDDETAVTVRVTAGVVASAEDIGCTCLLAPACLHRAAVASILPLHDQDDAGSGDAGTGDGSGTGDRWEPPAGAGTADTHDAPAAGDAGSAPDIPGSAASAPALSARERAAASALWDTAAAVLAAGLVGASLFTEAELARATHQARAAGLHRAAAAGARVATGLRAARERRGEHRLERFAADLRELLLVTYQLTHMGDESAGAATVEELRGLARRSYQEHGSLRLFGLFTEPVVSGSGYAGVVTYAVDTDGVVWSTASIAPGGRSLVRGSYISALKLGGTTLTHRDFGRAGLMVSAATSSADRRLGGGAGTKAVRTQGAQWSTAPVAGLFDRPLSAQFGRALSADPDDDSFRAGDDLVFLRGRVLGLDHQGLVLGVLDPSDGPGGGDGMSSGDGTSDGSDEAVMAGMRVIRCVLPPGDAAYQRNFERLGDACPQVLVIARPDRARPATVHALAVELGSQDGVALALPGEWRGMVNVGIDRIPTRVTDSELVHDIPAASAQDDTSEAAPARPEQCAPVGRRQRAPEATALHLLRHHVERAASAGRAITRTALLERDCARLDAEAMHGAASLLRELVVQAAPVRDVFARPMHTEEHPKDGYALTWLAAAVYEHAAAADLAVRQWSRAVG